MIHRAARLSVSVLAAAALFSCSSPKPEPDSRILVFSKTTGFRHSSIPVGVNALKKLGEANAIRVDATEDASYFNDDSLRNYDAVVFLNTTGDVLDERQQGAFERFIRSGSGFVGIHAAADCEYDWPWYGELVGAYFKSHPKIQKAKLDVFDRRHPSTAHLKETWQRSDEWYNFKTPPSDAKVRILLKIDESSYEGGENGQEHPMAWYHSYDGGRAFYTGLGHTEESYSEKDFLKHVLGGLRYAIGRSSRLDANNPPDEDRFNKTVMATGFDEPTEMAVLPNLDVLVVERKGDIKWYQENTRELKTVGRLEVYHKASVPFVNAEEGLMGLAIDPDYAKNHHVYMYYAPVDSSVNRLSRFTFKDGLFDRTSERVILEVKSQRQICCHTGGSIAFGSDGLLYLSTGDNSTPFDQPGSFANHGFAPIDQRPGFEQYDARRSSANTNDLRGKILRIRIKSDGTYEIPDGNLFAPGTEGTRPEIYVMGNRNPYRISVDRKTGFLYWGEVGPDAADDSLDTRGPRGYDELNQARKAGFFGWPLFVGNNQPYREYDYSNGRSGEPFDPKMPINDSRNNTGLRELPPATPAMIWYPYAVSAEFPELGTGGRNAMAGPVYHSDHHHRKTRFPDYFNGKLFFYDWMRGWIRLVTMDSEGNYKSSEPFMPSTKFNSPIDMEMGPDGRLYILEYGTGWFSKNSDASLSRVEYNPGNCAPKVEWSIDKTSGSLPLTVSVDATGTRDADGDALTYIWHFGGKKKKTMDARTTLTFEEPGESIVFLEVEDGKGGVTRTSSKTVVAGNESPVVDIQLDPDPTFFMPGKPVRYKVRVTDREDGNSDKGGGIDPRSINVMVDYVSGNDKSQMQGHQTVSSLTEGMNLTTAMDCKNCHKVSEKSIGPSYTSISGRYAKVPDARGYLSRKIIRGGGGVWGEVAMAAHPDLKQEDADRIVEWILSLSGGKPDARLASSGSVTPTESSAADGKHMQITATYSDRGAPSARSVTSIGTKVLKGPLMRLEYNDSTRFVKFQEFAGNKFATIWAPTGWIMLDSLDLQGVSAIEFSYGVKEPMQKGYAVECVVDGPEGPKVAQAVIPPTAAMGIGTVRVAVTNPISGRRRVYVVIRKIVPEEKQVFGVSSIRFIPR